MTTVKDTAESSRFENNVILIIPSVLELVIGIQTGSGSHPASYPVGTRYSFPGVKRPGPEADHSPPSSSEVKNEWNYSSTPQCALVA
jgi:hypothetical protein